MGIIGVLAVFLGMVLFAWIVVRTAKPKTLPAGVAKLKVRTSCAALILAVAWLVLVAGIDTSTAEDAATSCQLINGKSMMQAELLFGRRIAGHGRVSDAQWSDFLLREVTPRFPDGLTQLRASGQWRDPDTGRITHEPSFVVRIIAAETPETLARLTQISTAYRQRFRQQSVGLTLSTTCASF